MVNNLTGLRFYSTCMLTSNKLACHSFMGTGRRHETSGSETKEVLLLIAIVARVYHFCISSLSPILIRQCIVGQVTYMYSIFTLLERKTELRKPKPYIIDSKHACPCSEGKRHYLQLPRLWLYNITEKIDRSKGSQCFFSQDLGKCKRFMENCILTN